ncbi:hypothetical protein RvY_03360-2 [Ramazzottius varieornatus]|uniref:Cleavage/polyadenylation specificity factor A subunit N-terminal domain-containing protein n=1 Tax=Ramazzottius varieornatus TaxID=947166 RepID=A0A1D1UMS2_RAMVA|nr:hypothetical protein RvY_03360-2 [Ramazzottius varieornatus]
MDSGKEVDNAEADNVVEILTAGPKVNNCTFSNDGKFLLIASVCGYQVLSIDDTGACTLQYATAQRMSITLIQCALTGKLVLFAPTTDASNLYIEDYDKEEVVAKLGYYGPIQDVLANHGMFVVAVNTQLYIYRLEGVQPISQLTYVLSPFALSNDPINCYVAHCDGNLTGCVVVQDVEQQSLTIRILAHRSGSSFFRLVLSL